MKIQRPKKIIYHYSHEFPVMIPGRKASLMKYFVILGFLLVLGIGYILMPG